MAIPDSTQNFPNEQAYRAAIVADALSSAAAVAAGNAGRVDLATLLAVALYNLPPALKPALVAALVFDPPQ